jgi:hypothetical protein
MTKVHGRLAPKGPREPKRLLHFWASYCKCNKFLDCLKLFVKMRLTISFAEVQISYFLDLWIKSYGGLKFLGEVQATKKTFYFLTFLGWFLFHRFFTKFLIIPLT